MQNKHLDVAGLKTPDITFWSARDGETLLGVVALKALDDRSGEVKSMHVAEAARGKGAGRALMAHLIEEARQREASCMQRGPIWTKNQSMYVVASHSTT